MNDVDRFLPSASWKGIPPAMMRHFPPCPPKPQKWPILTAVVVFGTALSYVWMFLLDGPIGIQWTLLRTGCTLVFGLALVHWRLRRWVRKLGPEEMGAQMVDAWMKAQRDAAPWN